MTESGCKPKVSVVVPAYNAAYTIREAVLSALRQTMSDLEVVVCNDASTDETLSVLNSLHDVRLVVLTNPVNQGEGLSRDNAISVARGEWIAVLDADDIWDERRLETLLSATRGESDVMVFDDLLICHHTENGLVPWRAMRGVKAFNAQGRGVVDVPVADWARSTQFLIKPLIHAATLRESGVKHSTLKFGADTEFFLRLIAQGVRLRYVPKAYYWYRITPNSASANGKRMELMNGMLESLLPLFNALPSVQNAIRGRIEYRVFLQELKSGHIISAVKLVFSSPKIFLEFSYRAVRQVLYFAHRWLHSGSSR